MTVLPAEPVPTRDLRKAAAVIVLAIGLSALAVLLYYLIDILLVLFLGIIVAAALQPWHVALCRYGVPRGFAIVLIYLLIFGGLLLVGAMVGPMLAEKATEFVSLIPAKYASAQAMMRASDVSFLRIVGGRLPPFEVLLSTVAGVAPGFYQSFMGFTAALLTAFAYFVTVFAVAFYWTLDLPRFERLVLSFVPVAQRASVLNIWHEIEFKLGAFIRGQGLAMLVIAVASAIGYTLIGLPDALALALIAGLLEAIPVIGPVLAAVPAIVAALPLGMTTVLMVIGWAILLQGLENNVLIPRIMSHAVGVSALVSLLAVLAFGTLYGILGIFIAIPLTAVMQVLLDWAVIESPPLPADAQPADSFERLRARLQVLQQRVRRRFRERDARVGIDPENPDHVVDAADEQLEKAVERIATAITLVQEVAATSTSDEDAATIRSLHQATEHIEQAIENMTALVGTAGAKTEPGGSQDEVDELERAAERVEHAVEQVQTEVESTQAPAAEPSAGNGRGVAPLNRRSKPRRASRTSKRS